MEIQNAVVPSLERALNVIEYLSEHREPISLKQISKDLNIPSASTFRLVKNLVNRGYVAESSTGQNCYILGYKIMSIASRHEQNSSLQAAAKPFMLSLAERLKQTVQLALWKSNSLMYIDHAFSFAPLSIIAPLYEPIEINVSASAQIILANLPENERAAAIESCSFKPLTAYTVTDKELFKQKIRWCAESGYGYDDQEFSIGIGCLAAPVFDGKSRCIGAIGITGSISSYHDRDNFNHMLDALKQTSAKITDVLSASSRAEN